MKPPANTIMPIGLPLALLCFVLLATSTVVAQTSVAPFLEESAPVVIDGMILFNVFGLQDFPAKRRAREIAQRIRTLARDPGFDPETLQVRVVEGTTGIFAGDQRLTAVLPEDAQIVGMQSSRAEFIAREVYLKRITQAIQRYRQERLPETLRKNSLHALLRTVILVVLLLLVFWSFSKFNRVLERRFQKRIEALEAKSSRIIRSQQIWTVLRALLRLARALLVITLIYVFINFVLSLFPWTRHVANTLLGYVTDPLLVMGRAIVDYLPNLFFLILFFLIVRFLLRLTRTFFSGIDRGSLRISGFPAEWAWPTYRILRVAVIMLAVVIAYPYIPGSQSEAFKGISLLLGVLFSLGSTSLISNIIAGYTMTYRRAFKIGDRVKIGNHIGEVTSVRLLVTHMRSLKNEEIVLPNSVILGGEIVNFSTMAGERGLILHTEVGIGYEVPWRQVEAMLLLAAERTPGLMKQPEPFIHQKALGDFAVTYELNVYCREADKMPQLYTELHRHIQDVFNEFGVQIMTPHYEMDTEEPKLVARDRWHTAPARPPQETGSAGKPEDGDS